MVVKASSYSTTSASELDEDDDFDNSASAFVSLSKTDSRSVFPDDDIKTNIFKGISFATITSKQWCFANMHIAQH
jgi:hypothetical protein